MNTLILNRDTFKMPEDGWYQIAPLGEFPHQPTGVVQVVDGAACEAMLNAFREQSGTANFAGLLIDFDHFSLDDKLKSEAAGWITDIECRLPNAECRVEEKRTADTDHPNDAGLWARIRWSDLGEEAVKGGRYRFLSPVWSQRDCQDLGDGRLRPIRLLNAAVTNDPNLKGMVPLSNRSQGDSRPSSSEDSAGTSTAAKGAEERYRWELGESPKDRHCPSCVALAGQVHTKADWDAAGLSPGSGGLYCQGNCHCSLVKTDEPKSGSLADAPQREPASAPQGDSEAGSSESSEEFIENGGWSDEARAASLAVRRAKAAARKAAAEKAAGATSGGSVDSSDGDGGHDGSANDDYLSLFEDEGLADMPPEAVEALTEQIREKLQAGEPLEPGEERFLMDRAESGYAGESDGDPVFNWVERRSMEESEGEQAEAEQAIDEIHDRAEGLMGREADGEALSAEESEFLRRYREILGNRLRSGGASTRHDRQGDVLANVGWSDEARAAALAVRRAKAAARAAGKELAGGGAARRPTPAPVPIDRDGMYFAGGSPQFLEDERGVVATAPLPMLYPTPQFPEEYPVFPGMPAGVPVPGQPQPGDPRLLPPGAGTPFPVQPIPANPNPGHWYGDDGIVWSPDAGVAAAKARRRALMQSAFAGPTA